MRICIKVQVQYLPMTFSSKCRFYVKHLEPDILECEVKWALGIITMNKASGGDGISVELFQILKDHAVTLRACLEVLVGECSYSYTLDRRPVLLYRGWSSSSTECAASGGTHMER